MNIKESMEEIRRQQLEALKQKTQMPSLIEMGKNLISTATNAAKDVAAGNNPSATEEQANSRLQICRGCEHYVSERCTQCGCYMSVKTYIRAASCPVGKW